jgi:hypothetical protein
MCQDGVGANAQVFEEGTHISARTGTCPRVNGRAQPFQVVTQSYLLILQGIASISYLILSFLLEPKMEPSKHERHRSDSATSAIHIRRRQGRWRVF